jgi:NodT family efflux transporter outer membrane factor (OMF) lipoprotein
MQPKHTFAALLAAGLSAACAVGPDYVRPDIPLPGQFLGEQAIVQGHTRPSTDLATWWAEFHDPQLTHFVTLALSQNLDLAQAAARVAQARAGLGAASAALQPDGQASGQAARAYRSMETPLGQVLGSNPNFNRYGTAQEINLGVHWELDLFGGLGREREAALAEYQASEAGAMATRLAIAAQTADIYITLRGLQARLDVARQQVQTQQKRLSMTTLLYAKGLTAELQVRQAESALAQAQASLPLLEARLSVAMNGLDVMLGSPPGTHRAAMEAAAPLPAAPQITATGAPGALLRRRPDLIVAERRLAASSARIGVAIAEYYPRLSLGGLLGSATALSDGRLLTSGASQAAGVLDLRWRLFDFKRINMQIEQARGLEAEALQAYRLATLRATEDVENALSALIKHEEAAARLTQSVGALARARDASWAAYQKGAVSQMEVLQADEQLLRASDARIQAHTEATRATVATFKALGGGWHAQEPQEQEALAAQQAF